MYLDRRAATCSLQRVVALVDTGYLFLQSVQPQSSIWAVKLLLATGEINTGSKDEDSLDANVVGYLFNYKTKFNYYLLYLD